MTAKRGLSLGLNLLVVAVLACWMVLLRPLMFGGPATYVVIHGNSMYPTFREGQLVITHRQASYGVGDIVAYRVPKGRVGSGYLVIHRIVGGSPDAGFLMKGDHNGYQDPWRPSSTDIVGSSWIVVPIVGRLLVVVRQPIVAAIIAALAALFVTGRGWGRPRATRLRWGSGSG